MPGSRRVPPDRLMQRLQQFRRKISPRYDIQRMILFGSRARGHPRRDSEMRTTAALETGSGRTVIGSGATHDLSPAQRAALRPGEIAAKVPGADAEVTVLHKALGLGEIPRAMGVTRNICPNCQTFIEATGGVLTGPRMAVWPGVLG